MSNSGTHKLTQIMIRMHQLVRKLNDGSTKGSRRFEWKICHRQKIDGDSKRAIENRTTNKKEIVSTLANRIGSQSNDHRIEHTEQSWITRNSNHYRKMVTAQRKRGQWNSFAEMTTRQTATFEARYADMQIVFGLTEMKPFAKTNCNILSNEIAVGLTTMASSRRGIVTELNEPVGSTMRWRFSSSSLSLEKWKWLICEKFNFQFSAVLHFAFSFRHSFPAHFRCFAVHFVKLAIFIEILILSIVFNAWKYLHWMNLRWFSFFRIHWIIFNLIFSLSAKADAKLCSPNQRNFPTSTTWRRIQQIYFHWKIAHRK